MTNLNFSTQERFWSKVDKRGPDDCWEWMASKTIQGYGHFRLNGKTEHANRTAWKLANGGIPDGMCVCHHCDNPSCANPTHLFLGTVADNNRDCVSKGRDRHIRGEEHSRAILTAFDVRFIRHWLKTGHTQQKIADAFGVSDSAINHINTGRNWRLG